VLDVRSGFRGTVDYDDATVLSSDTYNGLRIVPLIGERGQWAVLVFNMDGEFEEYRGLRRL
jgi:hypothetical protein